MKATTLLLTVFLCVFLTACGGGGSGGSRAVIDEPIAPRPQPQEQTAFENTGGAATLPDISGIFGNFDSDEPTFGSVFQSVEHGISPVTNIDTTFTGDRFALHLHRQDGSSTVLDTARDQTILTARYTAGANPVRNRPAASGYTGRVGGNSGVATGAFVEWANGDFTDYLAGGYWLYAEGNPSQPALELGAFVDGPVFDDFTLTLPVTGTATYRGRAGGVYAVIGGREGVAEGVPIGTVAQGEYEGRAVLTADFGQGQIAGRVDQFEYGNITSVTPTGETWYTDYDRDTDNTVVTLGATPFNANGQFTGSDITITDDTPAIYTASGSWGGQFGNVVDSQGNPQIVAGTNAVYVQTDGGTESIFTGAFYGATERGPLSEGPQITPPVIK